MISVNDKTIEQIHGPANWYVWILFHVHCSRESPKTLGPTITHLHDLDGGERIMIQEKKNIFGVCYTQIIKSNNKSFLTKLRSE